MVHTLKARAVLIITGGLVKVIAASLNLSIIVVAAKLNLEILLLLRISYLLRILM